MRSFKGSILVTILGLIFAVFWGGYKAFFLTLILAVLEVSLSFDNAIMNAHVLQKMDPIWQKRFLTWGMLIAVFGVRFLLPIVLVMITARINPFQILDYSKHLFEAQYTLNAFGGLFLLLVFSSFLFDHRRTLHWLGSFERKLGHLGSFRFINILMGLLILGAIQFITPETKKVEVILAGLVGMLLWFILHSVTVFLKKDQKLLPSLGVLNFCYLEVLDASFSFDGVIGAFAITKDIVVIMLGLGMGALFVRSLTVFFIQRRTLQKYLFLEHGAYYAIGALGCIMLLNLAIHTPEIVTGLIGVSFILTSLLSSIYHNKKNTNS